MYKVTITIKRTGRIMGSIYGTREQAMFYIENTIIQPGWRITIDHLIKGEQKNDKGNHH